MHGRTWRRTLALHFVTWSLIGAVSLVMCELALRLSGRVTVESVMTATADAFERIPGVFQPGQRVLERPRPELEHRITINSLGYRGRDIDPANRKGRLRLMCLGDSFTFGSYVDDDQTLPAQLEKALQEQGLPVDVINAGVGGTTIVDQLYVLKKGAGLEVDIVLLTFSENDISDLARDEPMFVALERNRRLKSRPGLREIHALVRNTALFNFALTARGWYQARHTDPGAGGGAGEPAARLEGLWSRYNLLLGEMQAYLAARNVPLILAIFPSHYRIGPGGRGDDRIERVEELARRRGIRTLNLLGPFRAAGRAPTELYLLPYDGHPSARGYAVAARTLARELGTELRGKVPRAGGRRS